MTLENLQREMLIALKNGDKTRKSVLSMVIAQIKKSAIDKGIRDNITEDFVDIEILRYQKMMKETVESLHSSAPKLEQAREELSIINEYVPHVIDTPHEIRQILAKEYTGPATKKDIMKFLSANYRGKMDMKIASSVADVIVGG